jgi:uncharacterized protein with HEPN domain
MSNTLPEKDRIRFQHMLDYAQEAVAFVQGRSLAGFIADRKLHLAVTHLVELVGEAATHISADTRNQYAQIPWPQIIGMRHRLIHGYDFLDYRILWQTVQEDLPALIPLLTEILSPFKDA